ncbi:SacI homology domain-containing protein [Gorgonomyces haynaldii]|nr:SacI homology domain-containing protein [Gorgonomyces haynaldii]
MFATLHQYTSDLTLIFEPVFLDPRIPRESLVIDRTNGQLQMNVPTPQSIYRNEQVSMVHGIIGILELHARDYLLVVTGKSKVGQLLGNDVYLLTGYKVLPVQLHERSVDPQLLQDDALYLSMLNEMLAMQNYYFSYTLDLTNTQQRMLSLAHLNDLPIHKRLDDRFFWNQHLMSKILSTPGSDRFILPLICGFVHLSEHQIENQSFTYGLISRRSRFRSGARYHSRGVDQAGEVSNFVETEQLVLTNTIFTSHVQTRGSIPLFWQQQVTLRYKPRLVLERRQDTLKAFQMHFEKQFKIYGDQLAVNLINKHGYESSLGVEFQRMVDLYNDPRLYYTHFDFHKECSKMRWDRISLLINELEPLLLKQSFFGYQAGRTVSRQSSVVRTNCMDCLDRTNVVQSVIAKEFLKKQLQFIGIAQTDERFEKLYKNVWADHADTISIQYSGTGALKTDFTRTGKRSIGGVLQDLFNSVLRYIKNHYMDGFRQDAFTLFHGRFNPVKTRQVYNQLLSNQVLVVILCGTITSFCVLVISLSQTSRFGQILLTLLGLLSLAIGVYTITVFEKEFVSVPKLKHE